MLFGSQEADISATKSAYLNIGSEMINSHQVDWDLNNATQRVLRDEMTYLRHLERIMERNEVCIMNQQRQ